MKSRGIPSLPRRALSWFEKLKLEYETIWACDFFSKKVPGAEEQVDLFALFFIEIHSHKVLLAGITANPTEDWILKKLTRFSWDSKGEKLLIHDRDTKFTKKIGHFFKAKGFRIFKIPYRSPNLNAFAESWVARIRQECLNVIGITSPAHFVYLVKEFVRHYNSERPKPGIKPKDIRNPTDIWKIKVKEILGGLTHHYYWDEF